MAPRMRLLGLSLAVAALAVPLFASSATAHDTSKNFLARMNGAKEVPGPGDEDGRGKAGIHVAVRAERLCFAIKVRNIELPATAAHIHPGRPDVAGPPIVTLAPPDESGFSAGCVAVSDKPLLRDIKHHPRSYYVNVHNEPFEAGAIRGQLHPFDPHGGSGSG
jgi:CHRD domain-containing protein